jgi:hypothetical protein
VAEEGQGENKVMQPANPAANATDNAPANATANALANPAANAPANAPANAAANTTDNIANKASNAANIQGNATANPRQNVGAQLPSVQANRAEGRQHQRIRDEVEIARRANYDLEHGVPDALDAHNPIQATELQNMHDQELLRRA